MRLLRPTAIIAALLIIAASIPQSLLSQQTPKPSQPKQPAPPKRQTKRPQRADALARVINELLKLELLALESPDEKAPEGNASEEDDKPPADDAPIEELVAYWSEHGVDGELASKLSDRVRQRLLEACEDRPDNFFNREISPLMDCLPENTDTRDRLYKLLNEEPEVELAWKHNLKIWLRRNSAYFRGELIKAARTVDGDGYYGSEDLRALARLDWNAARPILGTLASTGKAFVAPVALALLYEHAAKDGDSAQAESYRALLKTIVDNRQMFWGARRSALSGLMDSEWSGQEEWFITLFADPTLSGFQKEEVEEKAESKDESNAKKKATKGTIRIDGITIDIERIDGITIDIDNLQLKFQPGILDDVVLSDTDRWLPVVSNLVGHNHRTVHKAAVRCLVKFLTDLSGDEKKKNEIAQQLIPLLTEPKWAAKEDRDAFISSLTRLTMPELAPGLTWILDYDENPDNRAAAAEALAKYRDPRAIPALRRAIEKEKLEQNRERIGAALAECGGLSDDEMAEGVEAYARMVLTEEGAEEIGRARYSHVLDNTLPLKVSVGRILKDSETIQATEGLAVRLLDRAKSLRATQPDVAREILRVIEDAPLRAVEVNLVERIGEGWADVDSVAIALKYRAALMKSAGGELYGLIKQGGYAAGVAAAILNDERERKAALEGRDAKVQLALLACARYLRDKLPVELVGRLLDSPNRALAKAAESYLEVEDSAEARKLVLARHPGEAYILGDITAISDDNTDIEAARSWENELRKELRGRNGLEAIYAVARTGSATEFTAVIIRVRGGKAEMSVHKTKGRRNVRWLTEGEFGELKSFTSQQEIEDLGPDSHPGKVEGSWNNYEYLRLTKQGGRRIALNELWRAPKNPTPHEELSGLFYRLSRSGEFTTRYDIEDKIPGVEVVFADETQSVLGVCAEGREIRALIKEKGAEYRQGAANDEPEWREFSSGKPGDVKGEPSACRALDTTSSAPSNATVIDPNPFSQPPQSDGLMFYATGGEDSGIWKTEPGMEPVKIVSGNYIQPVITPDGRWLVAIKWVTRERDISRQLIRRNLRSGEEFVVNLQQNEVGSQLVYVATHGKVLVLTSVYAKAAPGNESYLLDPETGTIQPVKGDFRPLIDWVSRAPQSAGAPNLFWAAIYGWGKEATQFGRYDSKNFVFTPLLEIPELRLSHDDVWVDTDAGKIWFVYRGHLLRLPLPAQKK